MKYLLGLALLITSSTSALSFEWRSSPSSNTQALESYAFDQDAKFQTDALVVIKGDEIIFEKYAHGFTQAKPHLLWSVSKSFASAMIGMAIADGKFSLETLASTLEPRLNRKLADKITVRHLLQMSSGLDWNEGYEGNPLKSNVVPMLYLEGQENMARYTANIDMGYTPGERFNYSSGESNLMCHLLRQALGDDELYHNYPWEHLFNPLGITSATWERDGSANFVCSSYLYMTPRDAARFGKLYANNGRWEGQQLLSSEWIKKTGEIAPAFLKTQLKGFADRESYGLQWWLNRELPAKKLPRPFPSAPESTLLAEGHHGQMIVVFPELEAVIVRVGEDKKESIDKDTLFKLSLELIKKHQVQAESL